MMIDIGELIRDCPWTTVEVIELPGVFCDNISSSLRKWTGICLDFFVCLFVLVVIVSAVKSNATQHAWHWNERKQNSIAKSNEWRDKQSANGECFVLFWATCVNRNNLVEKKTNNKKKKQKRRRLARWAGRRKRRRRRRRCRWTRKCFNSTRRPSGGGTNSV